jgi:hypothetical protein
MGEWRVSEALMTFQLELVNLVFRLDRPQEDKEQHASPRSKCLRSKGGPNVALSAMRLGV